jgi:hypothetical protein
VSAPVGEPPLRNRAVPRQPRWFKMQIGKCPEDRQTFTSNQFHSTTNRVRRVVIIHQPVPARGTPLQQDPSAGPLSTNGHDISRHMPRGLRPKPPTERALGPSQERRWAPGTAQCSRQARRPAALPQMNPGICGNAPALDAEPAWAVAGCAPVRRGGNLVNALPCGAIVRRHR